MPPAKPSLTANQKRFVAEYTVDRNAVQAYVRAFGRNTKSGKRRSYHGTSRAAGKLLQKAAIKAELRHAEEDHRLRCGVDADRINRELAIIAFADPDDLYEPDPQNHGLPTPRPWRDIPPAARRLIAGLKVKRRKLKSAAGEVWEIEELDYRHHSKDAALDKLCRRLGLYRDLPPLEAILAVLPPEFSAAIRQALAALVPGAQSSPPVGGNGPAGPLPPGPSPADG